jgi:hypothetical protein
MQAGTIKLAVPALRLFGSSIHQKALPAQRFLSSAVRRSRRRRPAMGCGGSKEDVATGNTRTTGSKLLLRRKSAVSTSHSAGNNSASVAVKDHVVKDKVEDGQVTSAAAVKHVVIQEKKEEDMKKTPALVDAKVLAPVPAQGDHQAKKKAEEEEQLPESTMADEKANKDSTTIDKEPLEEKATSSPAPVNED